MKVPPTPPDEHARLETLRSYDVLDTPPEETFDDLTSMAAHICEVPIALISLVDEGRQWFKSALGLGWTDTERTLSFCAHAIAEPELLVVEDTHGDQRFADHPFVTDHPRIRFYAGCPLITPEGHALGTLCVIDHTPRRLHADHEQALRVLSRHAMALLELRRRTREVAQLRARVDEGVIDCLPGVFCLFDEEGRLTRWNENFQAVTGYDDDEMRVLHPLTLFRGAERDRVAEHIREAFEHGVSEVEATLWTKDGRPLPYHLSGRRIEIGGRPHLIGMGVDISGRKEAEADRHRLFEMSPDMLCIAGFDGHFKQINPAWERTLGYSRHEIMTRPFLELVHPDDHEATVAEYDRVMKGAPTERFENRYLCRDGSWKWLSWNVFSMTDQDQIYAVARDVTAEKEVAAALAESEERYRSLVESARDAIVTLSPERLITSANAAFETITGWPRDARVGQPFETIVHPDDLPQVLTVVRQVLQGETPANLAVRLLTREEEPASLEMTFTPLRIRNRVVGALGIGRDIRDRLHLEEQVRRVQKLDSVGRLAAGIAHDFNNVLTVQQTILSMVLADPDLPGSTATNLREVARACERASTLTRQLLLFSREQVMRIRALDLNEVVNGLGQMLSRVLGSDVTLVCETDDTLPPVRADAGMVEQVLMNLAVNARDAMSGGGRLTIRTATAELDDAATRHNPAARPGTFVRLSVTDTGVGIPPSVLEHMFEPFFTTKGEGSGTGLGLATVHGIVQQHQGWIEVDSQEGEGATFHIYFPAATTASVRSSATDEPTTVPGGHETILLVEDEDTVRVIAERILRDLGYQVLTASDGAQAMEVWAEHHDAIEMLLTDMVMPHGVSGRVLAERLQRQRPNLKVLFASGYSADTAVLRESLGARFAFLQKPYTRTRLAQAVRACLDAPP